MNDSLQINLDAIEEGLILTIDSRYGNTLDDKDDAKEYGEARYQLKEGFTYDYEFNFPEFSFEKDQIVQPHSRKQFRGTIAPNIYVGTLSLPVYKSDIEVGFIEFEVQSVKTGYRNHYRDMLALITEKCTDLLMQANSPVYHHFEIDYENDNQTLYQRFAFIKSIIFTDEFSESVHRVVSAPVTRWRETTELTDICKINRFNNSNIRELISRSRRYSLRENSYLRSQGLKTLPDKISTVRKSDTVDTPENRFVKYVLETFLQFCAGINRVSAPGSRLYHESGLLVIKLESFLHHSVFKEISRPSTLKLNSPVLQRKEGYREILKVWLMFDLAAKLVWKGGENVYQGGKKDIATLYEYWLFFKLLDLFKSVFQIDPKHVHDLIKPTDDGLNLQLKQGYHTAIEGVYNSKSRKLNIRFSYNRPFTGGRKYPEPGSWVGAMRPDYTLSVWPFGISECEAERQELIVHIHFDAKYKVSNLREIVNEAKYQNNATELCVVQRSDLDEFDWFYISKLLTEKGYAKYKNENELSLLSFFWEQIDNEELGNIKGEEYQYLIEVIQQSYLNEEKEENRKGNYKNADLLKMHAYKDAIRRTGGAYVLYPGDKSLRKKGFHEIIPGLGAFPVHPSKTDDGIKELKAFVLEVIDHFINRASQREKIAYKVFDIYQDKNPNKLEESLPETIGENRGLIPDETYVIIGYCKSDIHLKWYKDRGKYNFRMNDRDGSLIIDETTVKAKYLILRRNGKAKDVFKIISKGPNVYSKRRLTELGYPDPHEEECLVIDIEKVNTLDLGAFEWKFKELDEYKNLERKQKNPRKLAGIPFTVSLTQLMQVKIK
ncbi:DUF2357 domain-containing protein [Parabacteroides sp. FAFU027]|uniref:DUF2357 domain-containing protein n=1 Tax=Parabacteroides sp. FAFU027 TaxID=2922715 RepID=UPI001FAF31E9|nr:DUF2357 domain-containing protein [Parabacteroides sp. FAFU027]